MATLMRLVLSSGKQRSCNSRCYSAKNPECHCICGGRNHSKGLQRAVDNTTLLSEEDIRQMIAQGGTIGIYMVQPPPAEPVAAAVTS